MTNRRGALVAITLVGFGGVGWLISRSLRPRQGGVAQSSLVAYGAEPTDPVADRLQKDVDRLAGRLYSEEGIPMILACENAVPNQTAQAAVSLPALNKNLASAFRRDADAWARMHPDAKGMDVAKIIEMLADRDFTSGGAEKTL